MPRNIDPKYQVHWTKELRANLRGAFLVMRAAPVFLGVLLLMTAIQGILPAVILYRTGRFISLVTLAVSGGPGSEAAQTEAWSSLLWVAGAILAGQVVGPVQQTAQFGLQRRFHAHLTRRMMRGVVDLPGLAYFEDPVFRDKLKVSEWVGWAPVNSVQAFTMMFGQLSAIVGFAAVAASYAGWVPWLMIGAALPSGLASVYFEAWVGSARWRHSDEIRRSDYYRDQALKLEPAKELRIFRLKDWIHERHGRHWLEGVREAWDQRRRSILIKLGLEIPAVAATSYAFMRMLLDTIDGRFPVGAFAAASLAVVGIGSSVVAVFGSATWARQSGFYLPVAFELMDLARKRPRLDVDGRRPATDSSPSGIKFENVTFVYPETERRVLDSLDLWIPSGQSIALVGENGAGKTTLIKLLCRFYDPTEGRILLDGVDIREFELASLRRRLAVIFQDFVHFHLSARDNVGFGAVDKSNDETLTQEAARRVGVLEKIEELPKGWDTPLARDFDGVDLSGGEWQRVALARAIMAEMGRAADILILDEPTASLDVRLEHDLYEHFAELSAGLTTLLVSHRFSTVRMAERIVFLEDGRIAEEGSHEELLRRAGRYAELYEMQASHYRLTGSLE